jgi:hypothetical protein
MLYRMLKEMKAARNIFLTFVSKTMTKESLELIV